MAIRIASEVKPLTSARKRELLRTLEGCFLQRAGNLLDLFFDEAEFRLFSAAGNAQSNQHQTQLLETLAQLKRNRSSLEAEALRNLKQPGKIAEPGPAPGGSAAGLALIEHDVFEAQLVLQTITRKADQRWFEPLYCLAKRYSLLRDAQIDTGELPMGGAAVGRAIHAALRPHVPLALLPAVLNAFDRTVLQHLGEIYDELNERLKQAGVLPNLEIDLWRELHQGRIGARDFQPAPVVADTEGDSAGAPVLKGTFATAEIATDELFSAVRQILQLVRPAGSAADAPVKDDREAVLALLAELQQRAEADPTPLLQQLQVRAAGSDIPPEGASADSLRFVDRLFAEVDAALHNAPGLTGALKRLQIPLARVTVQHPEVLGNDKHPVHQFINLLLALTAHADLPNLPLEQKISGIIGPIAHDVTGSEQLFATAASDLTPLVQQQQKARERNIRRIVDTYQGQQQLAQAQAAVDRELQRRNANTHTPALALQLLDQAWRHILTLTYVRHGESSSEWSEYFAIFDELLWRLGSGHVDPQADPAVGGQRRHEGEQLAERIGNCLDAFFPGEYRNTALVVALRDALQGAAPVETVPTPWHQGSYTRNSRERQLELDQAYPHLVRWFRRARDFRAGDEFLHFKDPTLRSRYTLVWVGESYQHFVFVDARGHKVFDFDLVDLANEMAKGLHPVGSRLQWPAIEQAMFGTADNAYRQLTFNSTHDELTGLLNRKEFEHQLGNALLEAKNQQLQHALLYVDIDQFSLINNLLGHVEGDATLCHVARLVADASPSDALLARIASNEFAVLIADCDLARASVCAESICRGVAGKPYVANDHKLNLTVSIGVIGVSKYADGTVTLLRDAVTAANTAKELGRNRVYVLQSDVELHSRREKLLTYIDKMNDLLDNDYLMLRAQPIQHIGDASGSHHYEILLGLRSEDGVISPPGEFIEAAECYNRMQRVDRWVIARSFAWLADLAARNLPTPLLSINLSGNSLNDAAFLDFLVDQFGSFRISPASICFEITETATIKNLTNAADFINQVKKIGCSFALDDFGTGLSSYEYLKHLPVDYLKIDGMFIIDIDKNPNDHAMVKSINEIAHFMGKKTIAEFVESDEVLAALREIGVDFAQGYRVGRPLPLDAL